MVALSQRIPWRPHLPIGFRSPLNEGSYRQIIGLSSILLVNTIFYLRYSIGQIYQMRELIASFPNLYPLKRTHPSDALKCAKIELVLEAGKGGFIVILENTTLSRRVESRSDSPDRYFVSGRKTLAMQDVATTQLVVTVTNGSSRCPVLQYPEPDSHQLGCSPPVASNWERNHLRLLPRLISICG